MDCPPFKVMGEATLLELARRAPRHTEDLQGLPGMTPEQIRRHAHGVLDAIEQGLHSPAPLAPRTDREADDVQDRYDRLHTWRKDRARARGVESDVILPRTALWDLARRQPRTHGELAHIADFGPWRRETYGEEILALLLAPALAGSHLTGYRRPARIQVAMSRMTSSATWPGTWYSAGEAGPGAGDEQVVERRIAVERDVAPRAERGLPFRELLHRHLIVALALQDQHRRLHALRL